MCLILVILYGQFMMHGQRNIKLIYDRSPISRVTIPEAVVIKFVLLMMSSVLLETC